jgi:WD40 repeat protein
LPLGEKGASCAALAYGPDGKVLVTGGYRAPAQAWDPETGHPLRSFTEARSIRERLSGETLKLKSAAFNSKGTRLLTASSKGVHVWDAPTGHRLWKYADAEQEPEGARWDTSGNRVVVAIGTKALLLDGATGSLLRAIKTPESQVDDAVFSPDGKTLTTAGDDGRARLWTVATGRLIHVLEGHKALVHTAAFSPDGSLVATCANDGTARLWNTSSGREQSVLEGHEHHYVTWVAFSPDGNTVVTASADTTSRLWDSATGGLLHTLGTPRAGDK